MPIRVAIKGTDTVYEYPDGTPDDLILKDIKEHSDIPIGESKTDKLKSALETPAKVIAPLFEKADSFLGGKAPADGQSQTPKEFINDSLAKITNLIPLLGAPEGAIPAQMVKMGGASALSTFAKEQGDGKGLKQSALDSLKSGALGGGTQGIFSGAGKLITNSSPAIKEGLSDVIAQVGSGLTSIPKDIYKTASDKAVSGKSIFGISKKEDASNLSDIVDKVKGAIKYAQSESGSGVGAQKAALKSVGANLQPKADTTDLIKNLNSNLENMKSTSGIDRLTPGEASKLQDYKLLIQSKRKLPIEDANQIRLLIGDELEHIQGAKSDRMSSYGFVLSQLAHDLDEQVKQKAPELWEANKLHSAISTATNLVGNATRNKDTAAQNIMGKIKNEKPTFDDLTTLNDAVPDGMKFLDSAKEAIARKEFRQLAPGQGGGSGSEQGGLNILRNNIVSNLSRAVTAGGIGVHNPLMGAVVGTSFSPVVHKVGLKAISMMARGSSLAKNSDSLQAIAKRLPALTAKLGQSTQPDGATNPEWLARQKALRGIQ